MAANQGSPLSALVNHRAAGAVARAATTRRSLLRGAALAGLGLAAGRCAAGSPPPSSRPRGAAATDPPPGAAPEALAAADTVQQIFTAALIAEDLATTFYYNSLVGPVIQDPALAGPEGSALGVFGSAGNVGYLRGALAQEIGHADLMRTLTTGAHRSAGAKGPRAADAGADPVQAFYFPARTFDDLDTFLSILDGLESAFIGAYLGAIRELTRMAAGLGPESAVQLDADGAPYTRAQLAFFVEAAAAILGTEAEHRALGRVIGRAIPANDLCYEQRSGIRMVWSGAASAVAALGHFVQPGGEGFAPTPYPLAAARAGAAALALPCTGTLPT
jgi:hypothetical protein